MKLKVALIVLVILALAPSFTIASRVKPHVLKVGINLPWKEHYGAGVGIWPWNKHKVERYGYTFYKNDLIRDFKSLRQKGIKAVRVFLFCDARAGIIFKGTTPLGLDAFALEDIASLLDAANTAGIKIIPVLFDYLVAEGRDRDQSIGEHPEIIINSGDRQALVQNVITPIFNLFREYEDVILAVDFINEPEVAPLLQTLPGKTQLFLFVSALSATAKRIMPEIPTTLGSYSRNAFMESWINFPFEVVQYHYYQNMVQKGMEFYHPANMLSEKKVIIGETEGNGMEVGRLTDAQRAGNEWLFFWSLFANKNDGYHVNLDSVQGWLAQQNAQQTK